MQSQPLLLRESNFARGMTAHARNADAPIERNAERGVTRVHSYVSGGNRATFWVYDACTLEAIRKTAVRNDPPFDAISRVRVLDPYFYA